MPTIDLLAIDWDQHGQSTVLKSIPVNPSSPTDLNLTAARMMAETASCNGYEVKDDDGLAFIVYREKNG